MFTIIVATNKKSVIGKAGSMPWRNSEDLKHFRETTLNHKVVMGRKTFEGLPQKLDKRDILVVTRDVNYPNAINNFDDYLRKNYKTEEQIFIAGGGEIYRQALPFATSLLVSIIDDYTDGDTFFPELNPKCFHLSDSIAFNTFTLNKYVNKMLEKEI